MTNTDQPSSEGSRRSLQRKLDVSRNMCCTWSLPHSVKGISTPWEKFLRPRSSRSPGRNYSQGVWVNSLRLHRNLYALEWNPYARAHYGVPGRNYTQGVWVFSIGITLRCLRHNIHSYAYTFRFPQSCSLQSLSEVGQLSLCVGTWECHKHMLSTIHTCW